MLSMKRLILCLLAATTLPVAAAAERSPLAKAVFACADNDTLDQKLLHDSLQGWGWRKVTSERAFQSLSLFGAFTALSHGTTSTDWNVTKESVARYTALQAENPEELRSFYTGKVTLFTHPDFGATLLSTHAPKGRQYCRAVLSTRAYDDPFLYQLRITAQVAADGKTHKFDVSTKPDGIEMLDAQMIAPVSSRIVEDGVARPGPVKGHVRIRQIAPLPKSASQFVEVFKARGFLSVRYKPK